jgi:cell division protein FtsQ
LGRAGKRLSLVARLKAAAARVPFRALGASRFARKVQRCWSALLALPLPRGAGVTASAVLLLITGAFGAVQGGHAAVVVEQLRLARDAAANAAGFRIATIALTGHRQLTREEILATAGVRGHSSLLFFDVDDARTRLRTNPWIADAAVLKLFPDRLRIDITERAPFALWQKDARVSVIAADGTVLEPYVARRFTRLPFVVGEGAQHQAKDFLAVLDRFPDIRIMVRASTLVAQRRWNLRLKNGIDVRLPEDDIEQALETFARLVQERDLLSRDIVAVDLRLADQITVRLSEAAAQAREELFKDRKPKKKGGAA